MTGPADGVLVVTGTGTGVGKTVVTSAFAALAHDAGRRVTVVKLAQTGTAAGDSDVAEVVRLSGLPHDAVHELASFPEPLAPATAARRSGRPALGLSDAVERVRALASSHDLVLVEGAGGLLVRFDDATAWTVADLAVELAAPVLVVASAGLGTLNHTALTAEALRSRRLEPLGVVVGSWPAEPGLAARCNLRDLGCAGAGDLVGVLAAGAGAASGVRTFVDAARAGLAPVLGGTLDAADFAGKHAPEPFPSTEPFPPTDQKAAE